MSLISQRPQEVSKKALNQAECVFAFQMTGPQERKALEYWLSDKGFDGKLSDVLPRLEIGAPHVWSPQWLKISKVVHILPIDSLDTSSTPKVGGKKFAQKKLEPIDLKGLSAAMATTIERAKADDPKELRKRIVELEGSLLEMARLEANATAKKTPTLREFEIVVDRRDLEETIKLSETFETTVLEFGKTLKALDASMGAALTLANVTAKAARRSRATGPEAFAKRLEKGGPTPVLATPAKPHITPRPVPRKSKTTSGTNAGTLGGGLRRMLIALAQRPQGLTSRQLGVRAGLSSKSGTFSTYLSRGRSEGWIVDEGERRLITDTGLATLGSFELLPEGRALLDYWLNQLGGGASRMLSALDAYPIPITNEVLGIAADISSKSGTFSTYLSKLRTMLIRLAPKKGPTSD